MTVENTELQEQVRQKATEIGIWEEALTSALYILSQSRDLVNAIDNKREMDEYIYHAIIKQATDKRRALAEKNIESGDETLRSVSEKELSTLSREELLTDPHYRAVLPIVAKIITNGPILRLHVDESAEVVFKLADFKRKHRALSLTEVIVTQCGPLLERFHNNPALFAAMVQ
jgi:hypothetical protein